MITLPYWVLLLLLIGFASGMYVFLKSFFSGKSKNWPRNIPKTRVPHDKDEETRRDFVANVSHELRTPVSIIKGFADSLLEDYEILKEKQRKSFLFKIQKNAERLNLLVEDLLSLAKLEKPQTTLVKEPLDLCSLIQNIEEEYKQRKEASLPRLKLKSPSNSLVVQADHQKIISVFENLIDNAIIHADGISCITLCLSENPFKQTVVCEIEDDGKGIPTEDQEMLFERFYRVDKGRSRKKGGTGLGLSIAREIIEAHAGVISVRSQIGSGTVFSFELPKV
jgi:signal transduction histidine kinase